MSTNLNTQILSYLKELQENNNKTWFDENKSRYKKLNDEFKSWSKEIQTELNKTDDIDKAKVFRIYRDVRFSKDKTPYKTNFGVAFHRKKPALRGGYYVHLEPEKSFLGLGFWAPEKDDLHRIRKEFEYDDSTIRSILNQKEFKKIWGNFTGDELKTAPKGFDKDHPAIDLIRRKQFIFTRSFSDKQAENNSFNNEVIHSFKVARPFLDYMSEILTTNLNGETVL